MVKDFPTYNHLLNEMHELIERIPNIVEYYPNISELCTEKVSKIGLAFFTVGCLLILFKSASIIKRIITFPFSLTNLTAIFLCVVGIGLMTYSKPK